MEILHEPVQHHNRPFVFDLDGGLYSSGDTNMRDLLRGVFLGPVALM